MLTELGVHVGCCPPRTQKPRSAMLTELGVHVGCCPPRTQKLRLLIVVDVVDRFYTALLSALEQTHCSRM